MSQLKEALDNALERNSATSKKDSIVEMIGDDEKLQAFLYKQMDFDTDNYSNEDYMKIGIEVVVAWVCYNRPIAKAELENYPELYRDSKLSEQESIADDRVKDMKEKAA